MNILFQSYNTCCQNTSGGVQNRIKKIYELLAERGVNVKLFDKFNTNLKQFDILHIFMLDYENYNLILKAKSNNIKVVISTIAPINNGIKIDLHRIMFSKIPVFTTYKIMIECVKLADLLIVETPAEKRFIMKHYKIEKDKIIIIPNGMNNFNELPNNQLKEIYNYIGERKNYILQVGRFDKNKNQLNVIKAMRNEDIDLVFIGGPQGENDDYYIKCKEAADGYKNIHFLGWIESDSPIIKSAYQNADLVIVPSYYETFGMVILEAISAGKKVAVSNTLPILEYDIIKSGIFNPDNIEDIKSKTLEVLKNKELNVNLENVRKNFDWDNIVEKHIKCYREMINEKNFKRNI